MYARKGEKNRESNKRRKAINRFQRQRTNSDSSLAVESRQNLSIHRIKFPHDRLPSRLRPRPNACLKRFRAAQKTLRISRSRVHIHGRCPLLLRQRKCPQHFRHREPQISLREVDAGTNATPRAVSVMIASGVVGRDGVFGGKEGSASVAGRIENGGIR